MMTLIEKSFAIFILSSTVILSAYEAEAAKRLRLLTTEDGGDISLTYSADGRIESFTISSPDEEPQKMVYDWSEYSAGKVTLNCVSGEYAGQQEVYNLDEKGHIDNYLQYYEPEYDYKVTVYFRYDSESHLVEENQVTEERGQTETDSFRYVWENGNILRWENLQSSNVWKIEDISYYTNSTYPAGVANTGSTVGAFGISDDDIPIGASLAGLTGTPIRQLPVRSISTEQGEDDTDLVSDYIWELDGEGYPIKMTRTDTSNGKSDTPIDFYFHWEEYTPSSVEGLTMESENIEAIFSSDGTRLERPTKGINIIRYKNGSTRKLLLP